MSRMLRAYHYRCRILSVAAVLSIISACTSLPNEKSEQNEPAFQVKALIDKQEYAQALALISSIEQSHPQYTLLQEKRPVIIEQSKAYETTVLRSVVKLQAKQQWVQALTVLDQAISHLPDSKKLGNKRKDIIAGRDRYIKKWSVPLAVLRAKSLPEEKALLDKLKLAGLSQPFINNELANIQRQTVEARTLLLNEARAAMENKQWSQAYEYILLAELLGPDKQSIQLRKRIKATIRSSKIKQLAEAIENVELIKAQTIFNDMADFKHDEQLVKLNEQLEKKINSRVKQLTQVGQKHYVEGNLDKAIDSWQQALALDPDNSDLEKRFLRARLFKSNYKKLQGVH